jgi:hypothetical protein
MLFLGAKLVDTDVLADGVCRRRVFHHSQTGYRLNLLT